MENLKRKTLSNKVGLIRQLRWKVRFLLISGREIEHAPTESHTLTSPKLLWFLIFGSSHKKSSLDKSSSFKEQSLHVASVKSILESHASYLMSGCAQLENFAAGLELIGQKLQISELQNRLDAEFLPAQMCSVKFKEWIVVLATLLQRSERYFMIYSGLIYGCGKHIA
ncbi:PREDICTED: uncharacterized protein LOC106300783 isoform X2 [Brassica oleracea var. oleracea]|uniref:uncharacterized protein LOC106300783 isoform X2 n=1 Tax=Brassica oleracea var. oleracea TaxID=109376 RepID=UPI0006A71F69|nr:PREDICTED: uncharacterized protein LOC106300783 isoform X2 [Brassica oleracea var. oleracea]